MSPDRFVHSQIVGMSRNSGTGSFLRTWGCLWDTDGSLRNLNDLLDSNPLGWTVRDATAVNEHGQIVGSAVRQGSSSTITRAILLTPTSHTDAGANIDLAIDAGQTGGLAATFPTVSDQGTLFSQYAVRSAEELLDDFGSIPPGLESLGALQVWDVDFSGQFEGPATLEFTYDETNLPGDESNLSLLHFTDGSWQSMAGVIDPAANTIAVQTSGLSPFVLVPEPSTLLLVAVGLVCLACYGRRRRRCESNG